MKEFLGEFNVKMFKKRFKLRFPGVTRIRILPLSTNMKTAFKYLLENDEKARGIFTTLFPSNVVEDASGFAQELWDKVSKDEFDSEDLYYCFKSSVFLFKEPKRFTKKEVEFLECCMNI